MGTKLSGTSGLEALLKTLPDNPPVTSTAEEQRNQGTVLRDMNKKDTAAAGKREDQSPAALLDTISAVELQRKDIPPVQFVAEGLLPHGLNILASPSKYGKSWMVLALCLAVSSGKPFLGYDTNQCECLYMALEDSQRRLKERMNKLLDGGTAPTGFEYATAAHVMGNGLFEELEDFLKRHPKTGLIVIDTLQKVRAGNCGGESAYAADYREVGALKAFADSHGVSLLLVHHLRKMKDDADPFNMISGTNGIMGAADTILVLIKEKRNADNAILSIVGRDIEQREMVLRFNKAACRWESLGDADKYNESQALEEYQTSPLVQTIKKLLEDNPDGWTGTMQQLMDAGKEITGVYLEQTPHKLGHTVKAMERALFENDRISHTFSKNGTGGGKHKFAYVGSKAVKGQ